MRHRLLLDKQEFDEEDRMIALEAAEHGDLHVLKYVQKHGMQFYSAMLDKAVVG